MLKVGQKLLLPCHEAIGEVVQVTTEKAVIRVKGSENYDVIVTPDGKLPHTSVVLVEGLIFENAENAYIKDAGGGIILGTIYDIRIEKDKNGDCNTVCTFVQQDTSHETIPLSRCYKLYQLKKVVDKMFRVNDKFTREILY